jgi:hypothetical protein
MVRGVPSIIVVVVAMVVSPAPLIDFTLRYKTTNVEVWLFSRGERVVVSLW